MADDWKKHLLKSGLPFEYEVKECFVKHGCTVWDEFSYLKEDENNVEKEFSYDLDANTWKDGYSIDFMIECKYKTEPTKWVFSPDPYSYQNDLSRNSFLHPSDHFSKYSFPFDRPPFDKILEPLGPFCLKGVEILNDKPQEINITRAISQLSYAFIGKIISSFNDQLNIEMFHNSIFLQIPIIITNAELYRLKENVTTKDISNSKSIDEVATKHDFLLFHNKIGEHLREYNSSRLSGFLGVQKPKKFKSRINSFTKDQGHFVDVIASNYSPQVILIMHHDDAYKNYKLLFDYINFITTDSDALKKRIEEVKAEDEIRHKEFKTKAEAFKKAKKTSGT